MKIAKNASSSMAENIKALLLHSVSSEAEDMEKNEFPYRSLIRSLLY